MMQDFHRSSALAQGLCRSTVCFSSESGCQAVGWPGGRVVRQLGLSGLGGVI